MAYEFVCESEAKRYCSDCSRTLKKTCELLRTKGISAQFSLVGSGARNMITRNGDGPYDLDYNLLIMKAEERYWNDLRLLKETVRNALNRAERREFFSDAQDSTSCLTALLHFKDTPNVEFSFDVAITTKNKNGNYDDPTDTAGKEPFPLPALQEKRCALGNPGGHLLRQDNALPMQCRYTHEAVLHTGYPDGAAHYADRGETTNAWRQAD